MDEDARAALRRHGEEAYPGECCGFLLGTVAAETRTVVRVRRAVNDRSDSPRTHYRISPEAYFDAERDARRHGLCVVGFYHSHPDGAARPSEVDRARALPGCAYVILAVADGAAGEIRSWSLAADRGQFHPDVLETPQREAPAISGRVAKRRT